MSTPFLVVKVGGSLYDLPDLTMRIRAWLERQNRARVLIVPGGGPLADVVRHLDWTHGLGEEASHWLAIEAMSLAAHFLGRLLPEALLLPRVPGESDGRGPFILDPLPFFREDEEQPGHYPHRWDVTSDSLAVRVAVKASAAELVLVKSVSWRSNDWAAASREGVVDSYFATAVLAAAGLRAQVVNLRRWPNDNIGE